MKRIVVVSVMAVLISLGPLGQGAVAQTAKPPSARKSNDCAEQKKRNPKAECVLDMEAEQVKGEKVGDSGENIVVRRPTKHGSLIRVRSTMVDKIIKSTNNQ